MVALLIWVVFGVALAGAELFTGNFVLVMFAAGALAAAGAAGLGAGVVVQTIVFTVITALALAGIRPLIRNRLTAGPEHKMGVEAIEGSSGLVVQDVDADRGMVKIQGELWSARAYDVTQTIPAGERVQVIEIKGATALVWRN